MDKVVAMKILGSSPNGGTIVELTRVESEYLSYAQRAAEGKVNWEVFDSSRCISEGPLEPIFKALAAWIGQRLAINQLQQCLGIAKKAVCEHKNVEPGFADAPNQCKDCKETLD
jgi:hypothetical protein